MALPAKNGDARSALSVTSGDVARGSHVRPAFQCQYQSPVCLLNGRLNCSPADP
ncbi:MAG TPA: hypothetical protein VF147_05080 [Vicinamibacterales bacterium]